MPPSREERFREILTNHARVAIAGVPKAGKTTLTKLVDDREIFHTDSLRDLPWEDVPHAVIAALRDLDSFVVEGVQVPRALRKGLAVDAVVWMGTPFVRLTDKQRSMAKGIETVWREVRSKYQSYTI